MGFRSGDHIISIDDYEPSDFSSLQADLIRREGHKVQVLRGTDTVNVYMDQPRTAEILNSPMMFDLALPFIVDSVSAPENAKELARGDRILSIDGQSTEFFQDAQPVLKACAGRDGTYPGGQRRKNWHIS